MKQADAKVYDSESFLVLRLLILKSEAVKPRTLSEQVWSFRLQVTRHGCDRRLHEIKKVEVCENKAGTRSIQVVRKS